MFRNTVLVALLLVTSACTADATGFAIKRLEFLSDCLSLANLDTLNGGICEKYTYKNRPLIIRVNKWNEVEHIGLKLFSQEARRGNNRLLCDFLERYLLERNVVPSDSELGFHLMWEKVIFNHGDAATALSIDTTTSFSVDTNDFHAYKVTWYKGEKPKLDITFAMEYKLLSGCDIVESEENFVRNIRRYVPDLVTDSVHDINADGDEYVEKGLCYIIPEIRSDRFYTRSNERWQMVRNLERPNASIANMMLTPNDSILKLDLITNMYSFITDSLQTHYRNWLCMCMDEGCRPFFGMKSKQDDTYFGTVFLVNERAGYTHMLKVKIPSAAILNPAENPIKGQMYAYIPINNISFRMLQSSGYHR